MPDPLWYKDAVFYELHVKAFHDCNGDGIGDFRGLIEKLDYLQELGVDCLWLLPFYPSPLQDDGYDIADYYGIHPDYGTVEDFERFLDEAHARGLRVIADLVLNHTSDQHPWFQAARRAPTDSPERDYYVWSDTDERYQDARIIFTDTERSTGPGTRWPSSTTGTASSATSPTSTTTTRRCSEAMLDVMRVLARPGPRRLPLRRRALPVRARGHQLREPARDARLPQGAPRAPSTREYPGRILLAEANQWPDDVRPYFGDGDEFHMAFHFPLMPRIFMALRREDPHADHRHHRSSTPEIPDELPVGHLPAQPRRADPGDGDRRGARLHVPRVRHGPAHAHQPGHPPPPGAADGQRPRARSSCSTACCFTLPGSPILYYGDEIGMGDNIYLGDRNGVRTPMQWTRDRNAGFSPRRPARGSTCPVITDPVYGYQAINVEAQEQIALLAAELDDAADHVRKQHHAFGRGTIDFLQPENQHVLAYLREHEGDAILVVNNLSGTAQPVRLDLSRFAGRSPSSCWARRSSCPIDETPVRADAGALRLLLVRAARSRAPPARGGSASTCRASGPSRTPHSWARRSRSRRCWTPSRPSGCSAALVPRQGARGARGGGWPDTACCTPSARRTRCWPASASATSEGEPDLYLLPLTLRSAPAGAERRAAARGARRRGRATCRLYDALADRRVASALLDLCSPSAPSRASRRPLRRPRHGRVRATAPCAGPGAGDGRGAEQHLHRLRRRVRAEDLPQAGGGDQPRPGGEPLPGGAGAVSAPSRRWPGGSSTRAPDGTSSSVAGLFRYLANKGRCVERGARGDGALPGRRQPQRRRPETPTGPRRALPHGGRLLPRRAAWARPRRGMHLALASPADDTRLRAEPVGHDDVRRWADGFRAQVDTVLGDAVAAAGAPCPASSAASRATGAGGAAPRRRCACAATSWRCWPTREREGAHPRRLPPGPGASRDGIAAPDGNEWYVIDFEGEPAAPAGRAPRQSTPCCATWPGCCARSTTPCAWPCRLQEPTRT